METQVRIYGIADGHLEDFVVAWTTGVKPLRERLGFTHLGAWSIEPTSEFVWILGYDGPDDFATADAAYYASEERRRIDPDPAQWIESVQEHAAQRIA